MGRLCFERIKVSDLGVVRNVLSIKYVVVVPIFLSFYSHLLQVIVCNLERRLLGVHVALVLVWSKAATSSLHWMLFLYKLLHF